MYRITLKNVLPAALLFASASAFAADNEVTLASGAKTTWANVVSALNNPADTTLLKLRVDQAQKAVDAFTDANKTETVTVEWLANLQKEADNYAAVYDNVVNDGTYDPAQPVVCIKIATGRGTNSAKTLYFSFADLKDNTYTSVKPAALYDSIAAAVNKTPQISALRINLGQTDGVNNYNQNAGFYIVSDFTANPDSIANVIKRTIDTLAKDSQYTTTQNTVAYQAAQDELTAAQDALDAAKNDTSNVLYKNITLLGNVTATETINEEYTGTIQGGGYAFNAPLDGVFANFNGTLNNAAVNGKFAETKGTAAKYTYVGIADEGDEEPTYQFYGSNPAVEPTSYTSLGELAYKNRVRFGVEEGKLVKVTDSNIVYSIDVYNSAKPDSYYVTNANGKLTNLANDRVLTFGDNVFVKSMNAGLEGDNVYYNGHAANVVITDGAAFYCPEDITADNVTYTRKFQKGYNTFCLPFEVSVEDFGGAVAKGKMGTYSNAEDNEFKFAPVSSVDAYTPAFMEADDDCELSFTNKEIAATTATNGIVSGTNCFGLLQKTPSTNDQFAGKTVYGLTQGGTFQLAAAANDFAAFRMVIALETPAGGASRGISFLEPVEEGMTGIESVEGDAETFSVAAGAGEIIINASADLGNVAVYAIDGRVAANAYVTAGTTTVNVPAGLYIVNGKKVVVK